MKASTNLVTLVGGVNASHIIYKGLLNGHIDSFEKQFFGRD
jgi:hypothetical protein